MPNAAGAQRSTSDRRSCPCSKVSFARSTRTWVLSGKQRVTGCSSTSVPPHVNGARKPCTAWRRPSNSACSCFVLPADAMTSCPSLFPYSSVRVKSRLAVGDLPQLRLRQVFSTLSRIVRSEEHTSELQSPFHLVCRLLLEKKSF